MNNKIVCIYPIDKTTEFLLPIFERLQKESNFIDYRFDTNDTNSVNKMKDDLSNLEQPSFIVFLGHGASYCLYGTPEENKKKVLFSADDLSLFQNHNCFFLSCRSSEYLSGKAQSYIGFGDIPTDYLEIISERDLGDIHYMCGIDETDIELYKKYIVDIILHSKRLLNYILCIRFFIEVHSIVSASRFFHMPTYLRVVIECQSRFFPFFPAFSRNCPDYFLHTSGSSSFRSLSDLGAR